MSKKDQPGEGNRAADQRYREAARETVAETTEQERAEKARNLSPREKERAEKAEREGLQRKK